MKKIEITKSEMKKINKLVNELYEYFRVTKVMPPQGDGAKLECAKEVHQVALSLFKKLEHSNPNVRYGACLMLLELTEQMILDGIDDSLTVEEMEYYE